MSQNLSKIVTLVNKKTRDKILSKSSRDQFLWSHLTQYQWTMQVHLTPRSKQLNSGKETPMTQEDGRQDHDTALS